MRITHGISGLDRVGSKLARVGPLFVHAAKELVAETAAFAESAIANKIDEYEAVDTGRLKGSISGKNEGGDRDEKGRFTAPTYQFDPEDSANSFTAKNVGGVAEISAVVGTNVSYAVPVHEGYTTSTGREIPGRPYAADAVPEIEKFFEGQARDRFGSLTDD